MWLAALVARQDEHGGYMCPEGANCCSRMTEAWTLAKDVDNVHGILAEIPDLYSMLDLPRLVMSYIELNACAVLIL